MIEIIVKNYLKKKLNKTAVYLEDEPNHPDRRVTIERTGGTERNHIRGATLAVQSHGKSMQEACELNESVKDAMRDFAELDRVCRCSLNSDYNYTDTRTKKYRYQAVFDVRYY